MRRPSLRTKTAKIAAAGLLGATLVAGSINVFVGSDVIPGSGGGGAGTANLWVVPTAAGTCNRSATPAAFNAATSCTFATALTNSVAGDLVLVRDGAYTVAAITTSKTSPGVTFRAENPGGASTGALNVSTGDWFTFEDFVINGSASITAGGGSNITWRQVKINGGEASAYGSTGNPAG